MISVGSRDGGKRIIGMGLEMEETEVEEGEALSYNNEAQDTTIDPDIALSYIEEKLQNVLGHFQKDFEGGVSAENLGAKFGGYGSFLPTYQRSPCWSHTRSPAEAHNYDSPKSTEKLHSEDQRQNSLAYSSASGKAALVGNSLKGNNSYLQPRHAEESSLKSGGVKKPVSSSDQRTLKVRIKVGPESLSTQKNAEIYSGLGLVVSPSSSFKDSPTTSEGQCGKLTDVSEASPTSILQIMISYPVELLLSPLSDDLIHLTGRRKSRAKLETKSVDKTSVENSGMMVNGSLFGNMSQKKMKSAEKDDVFSTEFANQENIENMDNRGSLLKKEMETEIDTSGCEELVSNSLKLPLLSSSQVTFTDPAKDNPSAMYSVTGGGKGETLSACSEQKHLDNRSTQAINGVENLNEKLGSSGKLSESKKGNLVSSIAAEVSRAENSLALDPSDSVVSKGRKIEDGLKPPLEKSSTGRKRKQKVAQSACSSKTDSHDLQKGHEKRGDMYKDFFGDVEFEDGDNDLGSGEMTSSGRLKIFQAVGERASADDDDNMPKEKFDGNFFEKSQVPESCHGLGSQSNPPVGNGPSSEAPTGSVPLVEEDWVSCDKCQKWRLLPLGTNLKSLPDKWLCRMLTWLPGMNRCNIPQEETTNALRALYHPAASVPGPTSETQHSQQIALIDARHPVQENQHIALQTSSTSENRKHGSTKAANSNDLDGSTNSSNSRKKSLGTSAKLSNFSGKNSPSLDASGHQHMRLSSTAVEKCSVTKQEKSSLANSLDKAPTGANLKLRSKWEADVESSRASKRLKNEDLHDDGNWTSDNGGTSSKAGLSISFLNNTSRNDRREYDAHKDVDGIFGTNAEKRDDDDSVRKRKTKEQSDHRKEKKARVSKSGGKDSIGSKANPSESEHNGQYPSNTTRAADYIRSDLGSVNPSVAANSSSSKVSGSHRNKTNGQEIKGSPVESVSSSPLRRRDADKITLPKKEPVGKDDLHNSSSLTAVGPRGLSGEHEREMVKKDAVLSGKDPVTDRHGYKYASAKNSSERCIVEEKANVDQFQNRESGKGSSSHSKDKAQAIIPDLAGVYNSSRDSLDREHLLYEEKEKPKSRKNKSDEKYGTQSKGEKFIGKKDSAGGTSGESSKGRNQKKSVHDGNIKSQDKKHNIQEYKLPKKVSQAEVNGSGKSNLLPPLARITTESVSGPQKESGAKSLAIEALDNGDAQKALNARKKAENSNGQPVRHPTPNSHKVRDIDAPSPVRRDSSGHAANSALKEAKDLKHLADRLKNSGSTESNGFYFQAALKFLHGASLLESGSSESTKHNELMHSMHIYSSTAKLCEFCAHEYEKSKDMAAAALAYKCVEVAYLRVVYSSRNTASRDKNELQIALQIVPAGESPSSSASDVDNLNHHATTDKAALAKVVGSPQVSGSHIITSQNRSSFLRILNFVQDVNFAMEASRKSKIAFTAAASKLGETSHKDSIYTSLKKALDFNFQDVEGLLRLVRVAMEAVNR
ncbi:hypothetical protein OROHE_025732 [Orobanche hederae]